MWSVKLPLNKFFFFKHITLESASSVYSHMSPKIAKEIVFSQMLQLLIPAAGSPVEALTLWLLWFTGGCVDPLAAVVHQWKR